MSGMIDSYEAAVLDYVTSTAGTFTVQFATGGFIQIPHV